MILQIFSACASLSAPPKTVKSWLKAKTRRPSTVPWPVTTPSPGIFCAAMPKSLERCSTNMSHSSKEPGSNSSSSRSRALSLPLACCAWTRRSPPPPRAAVRFSSSRRRISCICPSLPGPRRGSPGEITPTGSQRQPWGWRGLSPQQRQKPVRQRDIVLDRGSALHLLGVLAPLLDLEALVELRGGKGPLDAESSLGQRQRHHQRAAGGGGEMERGELERGEALDRGGKGAQGRGRL